MLQDSYQFDAPFMKGAFTLRLPICTNWRENKNRLLIVIETVDGKDFIEKQLLSESSRTVVTNVIKHARAAAREELKGDLPSFSYAAVNFNNIRTFSLDPDQRKMWNKRFAERVRICIQTLKPSHVMVFGQDAFRYIFPSIEHSDWKLGWVWDKKFKLGQSLDLEPLYSNRQNKDFGEDEVEEEMGRFNELYGKSNLLGLVIRNTANLFVGKHVHSLRHIKPNPIYIDTVERFDRMMDRVNQAPVVAWDTEGPNLTVLKNNIYVIQFAISEDKGFVLPLYHPKTPHSPKVLKYIHGELRNWFASRPPDNFKYLVGMNAPHDLTVTRARFKIPLIFRNVWDVVAGEVCLDENIKFLEFPPIPGSSSNKDTTAGNLLSIFTSYGNDLYLTMPVSKGERGGLSQKEPDDIDVLNYESLDVQCLMGIHSQQLARSEKMTLGDKPYRPHYRRLVSKQMSNAIHSISHWQSRGVNIDMFYLAFLKSKDSPLVQQLESEKEELYELDTVKAANKMLVKAEGIQQGSGLFGKREPWIFNIAKPKARHTLFFDVMELEPLSHTAKEKKPQVNKPFQKHYKEKHEEVMRFSIIQDIEKLHGTYVKGWWNKMKESIDSLLDGRLRPSYGFFKVVTGRLNSSRPNLQQVPTRSKIAKYIKRLFLASKGCILVKFDYSAHEVRFWGIISRDGKLAGLFKVGQNLRKEYRRKPTEELKKRIKVEGDIHILNVKHFFKKIVDKKHFLRDAIKVVVFGVIYMKGAKSLARDINNNTKEGMMRLRSDIREARVLLEEKKGDKELLAKIEDAKKQLVALKNEGVKDQDYAQGLIDQLFERYEAGKKWIDWAKNSVKENFYVYSPIGRRRNLYGILTGIEAIVAAMLRRGVNAPIQGSASDVSITAARLVALNVYEYLEKWYTIEATMFLPCEIEKFVHDALYSEVRYKHLIPYLYILQWTATYGVAKYYKEEFGWEFNVEPEISIELGTTEDSMIEWDWSDEQLKKVIRQVIEEQKEHKLIDDVDEVMEKIYKPTRNKELMAWLQDKYPILGVKDG